MIIKQGETKYICEICGASLRTKEICEEHEIECKREEEDRQECIRRIKELSENQHIFYANSIDDLENCTDLCFSGYSDDCNYEDFKYPCFVLITSYSEPEPYEDFDMAYINIKLLDDYIGQISEMKEEIKRFI